MIFKKSSRCALQLYGADSLKQISAPVAEFNTALSELAQKMTQVMHDLDGIGLAAIQIGIPQRLIVLDIPEKSMGNPPTPGELQLLPQMPIALVNPEIVEYGKEIVPYEEGCLSVPKLYAEVLRPRVIKVKAQDLTGRLLEFEAGGLLARCIQHECDHLDGKLFVDRLTPEVEAKVSGALALMAKRDKKLNYHRDMAI